MRRPWFKNEPVDETFFDTAPARLSETFAIARPASDVWAELTADNTLWWCRILDDVRWTSERPFGVGTTRTVKSLKGANVINEPTSDTSCAFTWTIAYESRPAMKAGRPLNDRILRTLHTDTRNHYNAA